VTAVRAVLLALGELGLERRRLLDRAGILESELEDADRSIPASSFYRLFEVADGLWGRPALGLEAGARVPVGAYEVLDYLLLTAPTLGAGLGEFARCFALATRTARYEIVEQGNEVAFAMRWKIEPRGVMFQLRDYSLAAVARRVRAAGGGAPARVELEGPAFTEQEHYARAFGASTELHAGVNALVFPLSRWRAPLARSDVDLHRTLRRHADLLLERARSEASESLGEEVRCALLRDARAGVPALDQVARALGIGPRTLQRRLRQEGKSFGGIADEVRSGLAREYLADRALTVSEAGYLLGFSEPSAFSRAFRRWTGKSPEAYRRDLRRPSSG